MFNPVAPYRYLLPNLYLSVADITNPDLFVYSSRTWISLDIARFYEEHCQPSSWFVCPACPQNGNRAPIAGSGRNRHNLHRPSTVILLTFLHPALITFPRQMSIPSQPTTSNDYDTVPTTPACTWWNRPEEDPSSGKLESTHPSRTSVKYDQVFFGVESIMHVNAASLDIRDATTSTPGTLNYLTTT